LKTLHKALVFVSGYIDMHYRHGGGPQFDMKRLNIACTPVVDFSVNINPLGRPNIIDQKWQGLIDAVSPYPTINGSGITRYYNEHLGISAENILPGNGSTELIYLIPRVLGLKNTAIITPSYHDYERASFISGAKTSRYPLKPETGFAPPDEHELSRICTATDSLWLGRPNNPTATLVSRDIIYRLSEMFPEKWFIIDEAFIQFADNWKSETMMLGPYRPNILVLNSITKFYALAGLRLGAVIGHHRTISELAKAKEPWTINGIADLCAPLLIESNDYEKKTRTIIKDERIRVFNAINEISGIKAFLPTANFILCHWEKTDNLDDLLACLLLNNLYIRDCRNFPGLENNFFRIGLRMPQDNDLLINALRSFP